MVRSKYRWLIPAALALIVYAIGGSIEARVVDAGGYFGWGQAAVPLIVSIGLACLAAYLYLALPPEQRPRGKLVTMPRWQGYGVAALSVGWFALAGITWFATDLKSPFLTTTFVLFGVYHIAGGVAVIRQPGSQDNN